MKRRLRNGCVVLTKALLALLFAWALMYLTEYFGWHLAREAGGSVFAALKGPGYAAGTSLGFQ